MPADLVVWLVILGAWLAFEAFAIYRSDDAVRPFTYWVREAFSLRRGPFAIGYWLVAALIGWSAWHFLIEGVWLD